MRLSEAVVLGLLEIQFTNGCWLLENSDGSCRGCLVGAAMVAVGLKSCAGRRTLDAFHETWPWTKEYLDGRKDAVCPRCEISIRVIGIPGLLTCCALHYQAGDLTADQIADAIRAIEPAEVEETPQAQSVPLAVAEGANVKG